RTPRRRRRRGTRAITSCRSTTWSWSRKSSQSRTRRSSRKFTGCCCKPRPRPGCPRRGRSIFLPSASRRAGRRCRPSSPTRCSSGSFRENSRSMSCSTIPLARSIAERTPPQVYPVTATGMIWLKPSAPAYPIYLPHQGSVGGRHVASPASRSTLRPQRLCLQEPPHTRCCLKPSNRENRLAKPTAPLASGRLEALRIALISAVAWSCFAAWSSSADARGMGAPYGWYDGWYAPPAAMPARKARVAPTATKKEKAELKKKDVGFGQMPKGPLQIIVSIGNQKVTLFSNGARVAQGPVSTGVPGRPTPTGVFSIIEKDRYHHSNLYSNAPMPYMQRITWSGVALHEGVLPGYAASHGCIRMSHDFAQKLWPVTNLGARVIVAHNELAPVDFAHPKLFVPKPKPPDPAIAAAGGTDGRDVVGAIVMAQATLPENAATGGAPKAEPKPVPDATSDRAAADVITPAQTVAPDADVVAAQATEAQPAEASDAGDAPALPQASEPAAPASMMPAVGEPRPTEAVPSGSDAVKPAPTDDPAKPVTPPTKAADQPSKRSGQVAVFVSRKEQKIFVRQGFVPLFDMPIVIEQPDQPLGTHVFTA